MSDRDDLLALEARRCNAISTGDVAALEAILSEDYVHVHMSAAVDDLKGHLHAVSKRPRTTTRGELLVRVYGDLAVLTGEQTNHMTDGRMRAFCHQVAVRRDGTWRFVSTQLTLLQTKLNL